MVLAIVEIGVEMLSSLLAGIVVVGCLVTKAPLKHEQVAPVSNKAMVEILLIQTGEVM